MSLDDLLHYVAAFGPAIAVYAGIRSDLAALHARLTVAEHAAERAHDRLDDLMREQGRRAGDQ